MDLEDKILLIQTASSQEEAFERYNNIMCGYGYDSNVYSLANDHPSLGLKALHGFVGTYPKDWIAHYNEQSYISVDPVMDTILKTTAPFFWDQAAERFLNSSRYSDEDKKRGIDMMNMAQDAGVCDGIGIGFISPLGEVSGVGLAKSRPDKTKNYEDLAQIYLLTSFFQDKFRSFFDMPQVPDMTQRELEILHWAAEGKSDGDIADIIGISAPTVRYHWKNLFEKLEVNSRWLAIIKAMRLQVITPQLIRSPYQG